MDFSPPLNRHRAAMVELVVFESLVALLALLLIISGFSLYVGRTFNAPEDIMPSGAVKVSTHIPAEPPLSLVEA